jgi:hypothetical protein
VLSLLSEFSTVKVAFVLDDDDKDDGCCMDATCLRCSTFSFVLFRLFNNSATVVAIICRLLLAGVVVVASTVCPFRQFIILLFVFIAAVVELLGELDNEHAGVGGS